ncbi:hypothetical protein [Thalassobaculum salexigens]|uniref:hypothetical protein n=1 Tax=Thalassobaculum salexigens TaxID=455360 RepID=UPI0003FDA3A9|nr:hypothetical protein [Thalassobaculum salexigens]
MAILMKLLAALVAVVSVISGIVIMRKMPFQADPDVLMPFVPVIVILVATLYALGEILAKLNVVLASLDRPQIPPATAKAELPPAEKYLAGVGQPETRHEPSL